MPIHSGYVGGDDYFIAPLENDPRSFLFVEVQRDEQDALRKPDQRRIRQERVLDSPNTTGLVRAILTFVLAVCVRRWQQADAGEKILFPTRGEPLNAALDAAMGIVASATPRFEQLPTISVWLAAGGRHSVSEPVVGEFRKCPEF